MLIRELKFVETVYDDNCNNQSNYQLDCLGPDSQSIIFKFGLVSKCVAFECEAVLYYDDLGSIILHTEDWLVSIMIKVTVGITCMMCLCGMICVHVK